MAGKLWSKLLNPAGGLRYHSRALLYRKSRWLEYRNQLSAWLEEWMPEQHCRATNLLLIAPSAGHCLPSSWLGRFQSITAMDLDPLAPILFRRLHDSALESIRLEWITADLFQNWSALLASHPGHSILFCNFLGQAAECDEKSAEHWFLRLPETLIGRCWASFHDRYSGELATIPHAPALDTPNRAAPQQVLEHFYGRARGGELQEHELPNIFSEDQPFRYWSWPLAPNQFHIIEGYRS